jgi:PAS domain S-box-containing protein
MLLIDPESADIVDANPAACSFYGWSQEKLTSMKITDINIPA